MFTALLRYELDIRFCFSTHLDTAHKPRQLLGMMNYCLCFISRLKLKVSVVYDQIPKHIPNKSYVQSVNNGYCFIVAHIQLQQM